MNPPLYLCLIPEMNIYILFQPSRNCLFLSFSSSEWIMKPRKAQATLRVIIQENQDVFSAMSESTEMRSQYLSVCMISYFRRRLWGNEKKKTVQCVIKNAKTVKKKMLYVNMHTIGRFFGIMISRHNRQSSMLLTSPTGTNSQSVSSEPPAGKQYLQGGPKKMETLFYIL